ncbi:prosaposin-like isoform X2 [Contarinia nasturtii]|uniref:prosaposin-like isoform X2 n=1 Tax=Contarinia nasturtii TaxID=265458 RepID=UPI0012D4A9EF|nr:prosaposin-like isoform X2 [Contarinia nasturtii]
MKLLLLVLCVFIVYVESSPLTRIKQNPKCALGQVYWCQSRVIAKSCNAVKHCFQTIWSKQLKSDNKKQCESCLELARVIGESNVADANTESEFKSLLKDSCKEIRKYRSKCLALVDKYSNDLFNDVVDGLDLDEICRKLYICPNDQWPHDDGSNEISASPYECFECQHLLKGIESKVGNNRSKEHIEIVLQQSCSSISNADLKKKCFDFVTTHKDYIVNSLMIQMPPKQMCHGLGFCATQPIKIDAIKQENVEYSDTPQCVVCQLIAVHLDDLLKENSTIDKIDDAVHAVCDKIPTKFFNDCEDTVENYAEIMISFLLSATPKQLCTELEFCSSKMRKEQSQRNIDECRESNDFDKINLED